MGAYRGIYGPKKAATDEISGGPRGAEGAFSGNIPENTAGNR